MEHKEYAYKMFNKDLNCTLGRGTFQYQPGVWYEELDKEANCVKNGFHVAKNPLDCMSYYHSFEKAQCWIVEIAGDMDEDSCDSKVSAQKIRLVKRLSLSEFVAWSCMYIMMHPALKYNHNVSRDVAESNRNHFAIAVGERPRARGKKGDILGILRTYPGETEIAEATCFEVDGVQYMPDVWYDAGGKETTDDQEE